MRIDHDEQLRADAAPRRVLFSRHHILETSPILLVIGILIMVAIGGLVEIVPLFYLRSTHRDRAGHAALYAARARGPQHLCARRLLPLPQPDDPFAARRGRALRPLFAGGREHVRPSVPVGLEAQRARHRARRRQVHRRLASRASDRSPLGRAAVDHADLRFPDDDAARHARARRQCRDQPRSRRRPIPTR